MEDPTTEELRVIQKHRETQERERADEPGVEGEKHGRRAERAGYLREKLEERARAEEEAAAADRGRAEGGDASTDAPTEDA